MRIGLIADTHLPALVRSLDDFGPEAGAFFRSVDLILHAGDVTAPSALDWLEQFAPVLVAQGNNDEFRDPRMRPVQLLEVRGWRIGMVHNLAPESRPVAVLRERHFGGAELDVIVGGHTHLERLEVREGTLIVNPGSPTLPHHKETRLGTLGLLEFDGDHLHADVFLLGHSEGSRNPARSLRLTHVKATSAGFASADLAPASADRAIGATAVPAGSCEPPTY